MEVHCQLHLAGDLGYMPKEIADERREGWDRVQKMIYRLAESLDSRRH